MFDLLDTNKDNQLTMTELGRVFGNDTKGKLLVFILRACPKLGNIKLKYTPPRAV